MDRHIHVTAAPRAIKGKSLSGIIESSLIVLVLLFFYARHLNAPEFHIDESHWIGTSYMFESYFKGDFWSADWKESHETVTNPPAPRYLIGIGRLMGGYHRLDLNRIWQYDLGVEANIRMGARPVDGLLWWSRFPMALLAVASIWMAFWIVRKVAGRLAGYFWIVLACGNAYLLEQTRHAMAESPILFFVMAASLFTYLAIERIAREDEAADWKTWFYLGVAGISVGLAGASKLNGLSALAMPLLCIGAALYRRKDSIKSKLVRLLALGAFVTAMAAVSFLGSYPYLWPELWGRTVFMLRNRIGEMRIQASAFPADHIDTWKKRLVILPTRILGDYATFHFPRGIYVHFALLTLGAGIVAFAALDWVKGKNKDSAALVFLTAAATTTFPILFTPLDWDRYYLFPVFFSLTTFAIATGWLIQRVPGIRRNAPVIGPGT